MGVLLQGSVLRLAGHVAVGESLGHGGRGESDDQGDSEEELLHGGFSFRYRCWPGDPRFDRPAIAPFEQTGRWEGEEGLPNSLRL